MNPVNAVHYLVSRGMTEEAIGRAVDVSQATINRIKSGAVVPSWETGRKLIEMAYTLKSKEPEEAA